MGNFFDNKPGFNVKSLYVFIRQRYRITGETVHSLTLLPYKKDHSFI